MLHEHVLSHIPNIVLSKVNKLIQVTSKIYPDSNHINGCPLPYCSLVHLGKITLMSLHFLECHKMELTIFLLRQVSTANSPLLKMFLRHLETGVEDFYNRLTAYSEPKSARNMEVKSEKNTLDVQEQDRLTTETGLDISDPSELYSEVQRKRCRLDIKGMQEINSDSKPKLTIETETELNKVQFNNRMDNRTNLEKIANNIKRKKKFTARKSMSNRGSERINVPEKSVETSGNDILVYGQKKKSDPTASKSTSGRLNKTSTRESNGDFCCPESDTLYLTPKELFEHTLNIIF